MLETILAISGKPGLYKLVSRGNRSLIVETLDEVKKRMPAFATDKVISLADIAMYTDEGEVPLREVLNTSCSDFLELDESQYHTVDYQFSTFENVKEVATGVYGYVVDGLQDVEGTMREVATDDAVYAWDNNEIKTFYDGSWAATNLIDDQWAYYYEAIAAANYFLENCPADFPESIWQDNYKEKMEQLKNYPLEVRALRAYFHFELLKRYRQIPVVSHSLSMKEANEIIPLSYEDAVNWIAEKKFILV